MSNQPRHHLPWLPLLLLLAVCTSCDPRTVEIQGLDELTSEIRSQRLRNQQRANTPIDAAAVSGVPIQQAGEQIQQAMAPLREVLTQLGTNQGELSAQQATLTQEMRRWTQLLVQSMHSQQDQEAVQLGERLAALEQSIAQQDARHREVEAMLGSALDHTANRLEDFLKRLGTKQSLTPTEALSPTPQDAAADRPATGTTEAATQPAVTTKPSSGITPASNDQKAPAANPPAQDPASSGGGSNEARQGTMAWLWGLALLSLGSGCVLLFGRRRSVATGVVGELHANVPTHAGSTAHARSTEQEYREAESRDDGAWSNGSHPNEAHPNEDHPNEDHWAESYSDESWQQQGHHGEDLSSASPASDKPEVEELWAAAALLGEAIGRLRQTGEPMPPELGGEQALPEAPPESLLQPDIAAMPTERDEANGFGEDMDLDDLFVIDDEDFGSAPMDNPVAPELPEHPPLAHPLASTPLYPEVGGPQLRQPAARHASQSPVTCRLYFPGDQHVERRLRSLLGADPRVLVSPAPQVRNEMGELEVSFALLPGLPPGERSLLEQQLRDTVA
jgi:hypothetical protein